ncbi:Flocculation suppression protein [Coemansia sp. Benny D115]|nr:Flocculation suppression protein [Coemansia sp. Benny D115]
MPSDKTAAAGPSSESPAPGQTPHTPPLPPASDTGSSSRADASQDPEPKPEPELELETETRPSSPRPSAARELAHKPRLLIQKTHAAFVSKLYAMVSDAGTDALISWTADGDCFKVTDPMDFSREVLPVYFKHGNWQSFVRQLNMYGFHKINDLAYGGIFGDTQLWMFKHPFFQRDELRLLQKIKRRGPKPAAQQQQPGAAGSPPRETSPSEPTASATPATPTAAAAAAALPASEPTTLSNPPSQARASDSAACASAVCTPSTPAPSLGAACATSEPATKHFHEMKGYISELQQANSRLSRENQEMRSTLAGFQSAFSGIVDFLEATIVKPAVQPALAPSTSTGRAESTRRVVDAFKRLVGEIAPVVPPSASHLSELDSPYKVFSSYAVSEPCTAGSETSTETSNAPSALTLAPFRALAPSSGAPCTAAHPALFNDSQTLAPIRFGNCAEPSPSARVPSLSPPGPVGSSKRRSSSSSSSSSNYSVSDAGESGALPSLPRITLPPISGMVDINPIASQLLAPADSCQTTPASCWSKHQQQAFFPASHQSSLRETLPLKRPRLN